MAQFIATGQKSKKEAPVVTPASIEWLLGKPSSKDAHES
jgi:hypothetical protein